MLLGKEHSLVADSTLSSSPQSDSKSNALTHIHRPVRTYGRRRDDGPTSNGLDAPSSSLTPSPASRYSIHNTAPPGLSEEVPPSPPPHMPVTKLPGRRKTARLSCVSDTSRLAFTGSPSNNETRSEETGKKAKAPTKKDLVDTAKERGRLAAQSAVVIPRNEKKTKFTVGNLLVKVQDGVFKSQSVLGDRIPASDPIEAFSSPNNPKCGASERNFSSHPPHQSPALDKDQDFPDPNDSDDSDLPETSNMFKQRIEDSKKKQNLKDAKARALACLQPSAIDDDDLEIVAFSSAMTAVKEEDIQRKSGSKLQISEGRKRQLQFGKVSLTAHEKERPFTLSSAHGGLVRSANQTTLNQLMAAEVRKDVQRVTRKKEEEWRKHGGQISTNVIGQGQGLANVVKTIAEKGLKGAKTRNNVDINDGEDEGGSDEDWEPELRDSSSKILPTDADSELDGNLCHNEDVAMIDEFEIMEDDANIRGRTARRRIIDSESEDENETENAHPGLTISREEGYRRSTSSYELPTEDEYDKENNVSLMYDRSEDKENNAVVRHSTSIFDIRSDSPSLPDLTQSSSPNEKSLLVEEPNLDRRRPLGELLSEESSVTSPIIHTNFTQSFAAMLQQASPSSNTFSSFLSREGLQPAFDKISEVELDIFHPAPLLQPGFSELFESATERQKPPRELDGKLSGDCQFVGVEETRKLRRTDTLNLTQDVNLAFQAEDKLMRKADVIFEKEQASVLEAATREIHNSKPELYVNELGFLTQTRPGVASPEIYRPSPTQSLLSVSGQPSFSSAFPMRSPLRTLSFTSQLDSPEREPPRRLKRYSSPSRSRDPYESTKPQKLNAFEGLTGGGETTAKKDHRERKRLDLSEFLADEAAESDDDDKFGFTKVTSKDDDEDGEDMDKCLDVLMDDRDMDEDTVAADLVLEKFKEQEDEQDKENEKLHLAAVHGELRLKRNRGVGIDDSDEESDNEDNERARRAMKRLRTTDRGDIKELEANADTRAFADTYNQSLKDDDQEFAYLEKESQLEAHTDVGYKNHEDNEEEELQEYISPDEMRRLVRERPKDEMDEFGMDTNDVSWLDLKEEEQPRVKALNTLSHRMVRSQIYEVDESLGPAFRKSVPSTSDFNKRFLQENKSRNTGTSRSVGGSAVTGHTKNKLKTSASSKASLAARLNAVSTSNVNRQVKPTESMLSVIADKRHHFA